MLTAFPECSVPQHPLCSKTVSAEEGVGTALKTRMSARYWRLAQQQQSLRSGHLESSMLGCGMGPESQRDGSRQRKDTQV